MGVPGSANPLLLVQQGSTQYTVARSLRFNSSDSAYLSRVLSSTGDRQKWTFATWIKKSGNSYSIAGIFCAGTGSNTNYDGIIFGANSTDTLAVGFANSGGNANDGLVETTQVFRDPSAWYHIVIAADTTQATASNRLRFYVNGTEITTFSSTSYPSQNYQFNFFNAATTHAIGCGAGFYLGSRFFSGYLADTHYIGGQQLTPSSFTEVSATTGQLIPKAYTGSYGTNGFKLDFADNSAATAAALGKDTSGNGNNFTPNNLSVTAGAGNDSLVDTPSSAGTDTGLGGQVTGNYATWNPLANLGHTLTNGNLDASSSGISTVASTFGMVSGKYYWEITLNTISGNVSPTFGYINETFNIATTGVSNYIGGGSNSGAIRRDNGQYFQNNISTSMTGSAGFSAGDVAMLAFDADAKKMWVGKNGTWYNNGAPASGTGNVPFTVTGNVFFPAINTFGDSWSVNFGQRSWAYAAPTGFKALCDINLPTPVVAKPSTVFDTKLYTGNGSTQNITGLEFSPDLVWIKIRNTATSHQLCDTVRGTNKILYSDLTNAEFTDTDAITSFNSDGWTMGAEGGINANGNTYVGWAWDAGSSTVTNTQGSITSTVRANASAGFSVVTWTGQTAAGSIGHGLNAAPSLIICKARSNAQSWGVYHKDVGINNYLLLDSTGASTAYSGIWGSSAPTSTVFSVPGNVGLNNNNGWTYVGYCFAPVVGYSSFGQFIGNGSSDGPFVYTGFRPRWVLLKSTALNAPAWLIFDSARDPINVAQNYLATESSGAEAATGGTLDFTSNGFKIRNSGTATNANNVSFIYAAFSESPFQYARAR